ncbi:MAG: ABC transporter permease, partial [Myxococcaceae bacterium]
SAFTANYVFKIDGRAFLDPRYLDTADVLLAVLKAMACGLYIPLAACWRGINAGAGAPAVGEATTDGVVSACLGCLVIDFIFTFAFSVVGA